MQSDKLGLLMHLSTQMQDGYVEHGSSLYFGAHYSLKSVS